MQRKYTLWLAALMAMVVFSAGAIAFGGDIKLRMKQRLPRIIELKEAGIIGENNQGYLAFVGSRQTDPELVDAENKDRKRVYEAIAKQQGTTADLVGQRLALFVGKLDLQHREKVAMPRFGARQSLAFQPQRLSRRGPCRNRQRHLLAFRRR